MRLILQIAQVTLLLLFMCLTACQVYPEQSYSISSYVESAFKKITKKHPAAELPSPIVPSSIKLDKNRVYVSYDARDLHMDIYSPRTKPNKGVAIIFVHGGGWAAGTRDNFAPMSIGLAERGYVTATISYRLSGEAKYPAAIHDVKAAIRFMRKHAQKYGVNPQKIAIAGGSAGGQIASLVGVTNGLSQFDPQSSINEISSDVQAIVDVDGLIDFTAPAALIYENDPRKNPSAAGAWFGGRYEEKTELWREASPLYYVNAATPPTLFVLSSEARFSVGYKEMMAKLTSYGIRTEIVKLPDSPHSFWLAKPWIAPAVDAVDGFLSRVFP